MMRIADGRTKGKSGSTKREVPFPTFKIHRQIGKLPLSSDEKHVLRVLADHCDMVWGEAFPSIRTIAKETSLTQRGVYKIIARLLKMGVLEKLAESTKHGPRKSNVYRLCFLVPEPDTLLAGEWETTWPETLETPITSLNQGQGTPERGSPDPFLNSDIEQFSEQVRSLENSGERTASEFSFHDIFEDLKAENPLPDPETTPYLVTSPAPGEIVTTHRVIEPMQYKQIKREPQAKRASQVLTNGSLPTFPKPVDEEERRRILKEQARQLPEAERKETP